MPEAAPKILNKAGIAAVIASAVSSPVWMLGVDVYPALVAAAIPWSTSAVGVFIVIWLMALIPTVEPRAFLSCLKRPAYWLPLAFVGLALAGTLWAEGPWPTRFQGINPVTKLLVIPLLLYHFERSRRAHWALMAFLGSCAGLMLLSWTVLYVPEWKLSASETPGVPLKNSIDQSQEFALCVFMLLPLVQLFLRQQRVALAVLSAALAAGLLANMMFAVSSRTALIYMPVLLLLFAARHLERRAMLLLLAAAAAITAVVWFSSPYLRNRILHVAVEYQEYTETNRPTSTGQRLEYWRQSIGYIAQTPVFGNGTGSAKRLFDRDAVGKAGAWAQSIGNPHNQTLYVAIQWGVPGCIVLFAMWCSHLLLFREASLAAWIGLVVVVQNIVSSILNSHLFDFHEGWMYVVGVGIAGGAVARARKAVSAQRPEPAA
jgi:O-antigen ligase